MTKRENLLSIIRRTGYESMPVHYELCPILDAKLAAYAKDRPFTPSRQFTSVPGICGYATDGKVFKEKYYPNVTFNPGSFIDGWGVAHEPGSAAAFHMTRMYHPMDGFDSVEQILEYPFPTFAEDNLEQIKAIVSDCKARDELTMGRMECTVWETSWYMRGMENLMCDMMTDDDMATVLLDRVTDTAVQRAEGFAKAGTDALFLGDDVGTQHTLMMSERLYREWLQPRLKRIIDAARAIKPDIVVFYHSCGYVKELIPALIEAGIDVLNPVQPECMDFREIHEKYGDRLSFMGTIGTQSVMPFGTPQEVRETVFRNLEIAGDHGGLLACPTHLLEPEVPLENLLAYIQACEDWHR